MGWWIVVKAHGSTRSFILSLSWNWDGILLSPATLVGFLRLPALVGMSGWTMTSSEQPEFKTRSSIKIFGHGRRKKAFPPPSLLSVSCGISFINFACSFCNRESICPHPWLTFQRMTASSTNNEKEKWGKAQEFDTTNSATSAATVCTPTRLRRPARVTRSSFLLLALFFQPQVSYFSICGQENCRRLHYLFMTSPIDLAAFYTLNAPNRLSYGAANWKYSQNALQKCVRTTGGASTAEVTAKLPLINNSGSTQWSDQM